MPCLHFLLDLHMACTCAMPVSVKSLSHPAHGYPKKILWQLDLGSLRGFTFNPEGFINSVAKACVPYACVI